ncbi:MAG: hypothetical protein HXL33_04125 [Prevotellaceae bacterium]|nr:hypothetical protein [Prevotellaceae bacterium]
MVLFKSYSLYARILIVRRPSYTWCDGRQQRVRRPSHHVYDGRRTVTFMCKWV